MCETLVKTFLIVEDLINCLSVGCNEDFYSRTIQNSKYKNIYYPGRKFRNQP